MKNRTHKKAEITYSKHRSFHQRNRSKIHPVCNVTYGPNARYTGSRILINLHNFKPNSCYLHSKHR
ncbi:hypothetical protein HanPSC8_Chr11g0484521 [Helianthus annuus]|nr:hypothetical protein HanPSC8_Chr11g0484521 [Helianthus annuus]